MWIRQLNGIKKPSKSILVIINPIIILEIFTKIKINLIQPYNAMKKLFKFTQRIPYAGLISQFAFSIRRDIMMLLMPLHELKNYYRVITTDYLRLIKTSWKKVWKNLTNRVKNGEKLVIFLMMKSKIYAIWYIPMNQISSKCHQTFEHPWVIKSLWDLKC
jgi:hypothetical protein